MNNDIEKENTCCYDAKGNERQKKIYALCDYSRGLENFAPYTPAHPIKFWKIIKSLN